MMALPPERNSLANNRGPDDTLSHNKRAVHRHVMASSDAIKDETAAGMKRAPNIESTDPKQHAFGEFVVIDTFLCWFDIATPNATDHIVGAAPQ